MGEKSQFELQYRIIVLTADLILQDLYEATAEISDADPCMSLTIRFLSLPNKDSLCIDEVYIFGDPIVLLARGCSYTLILMKCLENNL